MSAAWCLLTQNQLQCFICQDVLTDPVTLSCGHNFCNRCITEHWDNIASCQCPNCKEVFRPQRELQVNTLISEVAAQFRESAQQRINSISYRPNYQCHDCDNTKYKAFVLCVFMIVYISICQSIYNHKTRDVVPLEEEHEGKQAKLVRAEAEIRQMIQKNQLKLKEIKHSVELGNQAAYGEIADAVEVFAALKESVERSQVKLIKTIKRKQRAAETQAEGFIKRLEDEISELRQRGMEVELLSVAQLEATLSKEIKKEMKKLLDKAELKRVQQFAVDVTLDPDTANPQLILSDDGKQVKHGYVINDLPDNPKRFTKSPCVLGKQSLSKGRFYFEVGVKGKLDWELGLARESIDRKSDISQTLQVGYWTIGLHDGQSYFAVADSVVDLAVDSKPEKVGVFVDCEGRLVSFYDANTAALIHSFTGCSFEEKLYPFFHAFNSDFNDFTPLLISPVVPQYEQ